MTKKEKEAIEYYARPENVEMSFSCDFDTEQLLESLGIERHEEDSFENHTYRFKALINLIEKQQAEIEDLRKQKIEYQPSITITNSELLKGK